NQPPQPFGAALERLAFELGDQRLAIGQRQLARFQAPRQVQRQLEHRVEQRCLFGALVQRLQPFAEVGDPLHRPSAAASAASASTSAKLAPRGTTQLPPTHSTGSSESHSGAVSAVIPPVGQKRHCANGAASALSALTPPAASAGKNLKCVSPRSSPRMMSPAVAT